MTKVQRSKRARAQERITRHLRWLGVKHLPKHKTTHSPDRLGRAK